MREVVKKFGRGYHEIFENKKPLIKADFSISLASMDWCLFFNRSYHVKLRHRRRLTGVWGRNPSAISLRLTESVNCGKIQEFFREQDL